MRKREMKSFNILVVDDDKDFAEGLAEVLEIVLDRCFETIGLKRSKIMAEEERLRLVTATEQASDIIAIIDINGIISYLNPAFERITGFDCKDAIGRPLKKFQTGPNDKGEYERAWETVKGGKRLRYTLINQKKDGALYDEEVTISPIRNESGNIMNL
jgi:PAS domain S-box-containing protein